MQVLSKTAGALLRGSQRSFSTGRIASEAAKRGLVLGMLSNKLVGADSASLDAAQQQKLLAQAAALGFTGEAGKAQTVLSDDLQQHIALVGLGSANSAGIEAQDTTVSEIVRTAVANGVRQLRAHKVTSVSVGPMPHAQAAAEGARLALYKFDAFKSGAAGEKSADVAVSSLDAAAEWDAGHVCAEAQNLARDLTNTPANFLTPIAFAERVQQELGGLDNVQVHVHGPEWAEQQRMGGLVMVAKGSSQPLRFVEIEYRGALSDGVGLGMVGKGVTFDTGGYSLKPGRHMDAMKGDMGGGAAV
ncbi:hypothetical protein GGF45_003777, partial [Coemansia sp. RSA 551]